jgi:hypothetical protein
MSARERDRFEPQKLKSLELERCVAGGKAMPNNSELLRLRRERSLHVYPWLEHNAT